MRISDWSSDVCSSDLPVGLVAPSFLSSSPAKTGRVPKGRQGRSAGLVRHAAAGEDTATHALTARRHALRSREWRRRRGKTETRSEESRGGEEGGRTSRSRCTPYDIKKKTTETNKT